MISRAVLFEPKKSVAFSEAWTAQSVWRENLLNETSSSEAVWLLQHCDCYTIGRGGNINFIHFNLSHPPCPVYRIDRGGEVTFHSPGQLIVYPVIDLRRRKPDLHLYLRSLEQALIYVLKELDLDGKSISGFTGLWINDIKVASIGIGCKRWVTQHGLALNINCDLSGFSYVNPCGMPASKVGRLSDWIPGLTVEDVQPIMKIAIAEHLGLSWSNMG